MSLDILPDKVGTGCSALSTNSCSNDETNANTLPKQLNKRRLSTEYLS